MRNFVSQSFRAHTTVDQTNRAYPPHPSNESTATVLYCPVLCLPVCVSVEKFEALQ